MKKHNRQQIEFVPESEFGEMPTELRPIGKTYTVEAKADGVVAVWHGVTQDRFDRFRAMDPATRTLADMVRVMGQAVVGIEVEP